MCDLRKEHLPSIDVKFGKKLIAEAEAEAEAIVDDWQSIICPNCAVGCKNRLLDAAVVLHG